MPDVDIYALDESATIDDGFFDVVHKDYFQVLRQLLPQGFAWNIKPGGVMERLLCALGYEPARVERRAAELIEEADPRTTEELLPDWERIAGLPGACNTNPPTTLEGRRAALVAKLTERVAESRTFFLALAAELGYPLAEIRHEHQPFQCGISRCGDPLQGWHGQWTYAWTLIANATTENDDTLRCLVLEYAQAHTTVLFEFPE